MGVKFNDRTGFYEASYSQRHPITRMPVTLRRLRIRTKSEAERVYRELIVSVNDKIRRKTIPDWPTAVEAYLKHALNEGFMSITIENYRLCLTAHTFGPWCDKLIDQISTDEIRELIRGKEKSHSVSTQKSILKMIRGVFKYAVEKNFVSRDPTPHMKFRIGDKIKRVLAESQASMLLHKAQELNSEWYPIWAMALYTGMRNGELYALTWDKVSFERNFVLVDTSWNNKDGFKSTKTGDDRIIDIAPHLLSLLKELKLQSADRAFVLPRIQKWDDGYQAEVLRQFLIGINIPPVRFHDLRASWATMLLNKGVEPVKVMAMGGWKDIKTMMIYMRKAGVDIKGSASCLTFHEPNRGSAKVLNFDSGSTP